MDPPSVEPAWFDATPRAGGSFRARVGVLALLTVLAVPVASALGGRSGGDAVQPKATTSTEAVSTAPLSTPATTPAAPVTTAPATTVAATAATTAAPSSTAPAAAAAPVVQAAPSTTTAPEVTTAATASEPAKRQCVTIFYTVLAGDSWIGIANRVQVTLADLFEVNGANAQTSLFPGDTICLPWNAKVPADEPPSTTSQPPATTAAETTSTAPTTVAAPTTTAPATTAPASTSPPRSYSRAEVEAIIRQVWPDDLEDRAVEIAIRESNLLPTAKNYCCYGLFQIYWSVHKGWLSSIGVTSSSQLFDPTTNATAALTLYQRSGGWGPWE